MIAKFILKDLKTCWLFTIVFTALSIMGFTAFPWTIKVMDITVKVIAFGTGVQALLLVLLISGSQMIDYRNRELNKKTNENK